MSRARIIKARQPQPVSPPRRVARLISAREQEIAARCAAQLTRAEEEAAELRQQALDHGQALAEEALQGAQREAVALLVKARRSAEALIELARADLTRLAVGIAEKILGAELALAPERVVQIVGQVLRAAGPSGRLLARVHPLDLPLLEARWEQLAAAAAEGTLELRPDAGISRGGCVLETDRGVADGRIEVQLATLQEVLFAESEAEASPPIGELLAADTDVGEGGGELADGDLLHDTVVGLVAVATAVSAPLTMDGDVSRPWEDEHE